MFRLAKIFTNRKFVTFLWFGLSLFAIVKQALANHINNYQIYKYTFINLIHQNNLYTAQPQHFEDLNHYGPLFSLIIAPFTFLPDYLGVILWTMANAYVLYKAILMLPLKQQQLTAVLLISAHELMTASYGEQVNPAIAALIILSFVFINRKQDWLATLMIVIGTLIKLYGIVGLAFFFFSKKKPQFIISFFVWMAVLLALPMLVASPHFVLQCYHDWFISLRDKNIANESSVMQNISVMGMISKIFAYPQLSNLLVLVPAMLLFASSYLRIKSFKETPYQLLILASTLIFTVIFSTGSESPTYIIAFAGVAIWFINLGRHPTGFEIFLLVFALVITSLSPSDIFPQSINRNFIRPYALKALPCLLIWLKIVVEALTRNFDNKEVPQQTEILI
jgi:hypothetical protein